MARSTWPTAPAAYGGLEVGANGLIVQTQAGGSPGVVNVGTTAASTNSTFGFTGSQTFNNATVNLGSASSSGILSIDGNTTLTLGSGVVVQGRGNVGPVEFIGGTGNLINQGLINANVSAGTLTVNPSGTFANAGTAEASGGGILTINPGGTWSNSGALKVADASSTINLGGTITTGGLGNFDNSAGGNLNLNGTLNNAGSVVTFSAATGSLRMNTGTINGGTVQYGGGAGLLFSNGNNTLNGVTVNGTLNVVNSTGGAGAVEVGANGLIVQTQAGGSPGVVNVGTTAASSNSSFGFIGSQTFNNATVNLGSASSSGNLSIDGNTTLTLGSGAVVQGRGSIGPVEFVGGTGNLINQGLINANVSAGTLTVNPNGTFANAGTAEASGGGILTINPNGGWTNSGLLKVADATSTINLGGTITTGGLGNFDNSAGGNLNLNGTLNNAGTALTFSAATGSLRMNTGTINGGTVQYGGGAGLLFSNAQNVLNGVTLNGTLNVVNSGGGVGGLEVGANGLIVQTQAGGSPGVVNVGTTAASSGSAFGFLGSQTFNNATVNLGSASSSGNLSIDGNTTLTLGSGAVVQGRGSIGPVEFVGGTGNLINQGLINANVSAGTLTVNPNGTFANAGTAEASGGGILTINPNGGWTNSGLLKVADATSTINVGGTITTGGLGNFDNSAGGNLNLNGTLNNAGATLTFSAATGSLRMNSGTINGGTVQYGGGAGLLFTNATNTLNGVTVNGTLNVVNTAGGVGGLEVGANGLIVQTQAGGSPGVVNVGTTAASSGSAFGFLGSQTFNNATVNLGSASSSGNLSIDGNTTLTLGSGAVVQGRGSIGPVEFVGGTGNLINQGLINANVSAGTLTVNPNGTFANAGTAEASGGGILTINPNGGWTNSGLLKVADATSTINLGGTITTGGLGNFDNSAGGNLNLNGTLNNAGTALTFSAATGSLRMNTGTINGGTVQYGGGAGLLFSNAQNVLNGVTLNGTLNVVNSGGGVGGLEVGANGLIVQTQAGGSPGVVNVGTTAASSGSAFGFLGSQTFNNATVNLGSASSSGILSIDGGGTLTLGSGVVVQGRGNIGPVAFDSGTGNLINQGLISASVSGQTLTINPNGTFTNSGTVEALSGSTLSIQPGGSVTNLSSGTLTGGIWRANAGAGLAGLIQFAANNTVVTTNAADIYLIGANSSIAGRDASGIARTIDTTLAINNGSLRLQQGRTFNATANSGNFTNGNTGLLEVTDSTFQSSSLLNNGTITSFGTSALTTTPKISGSGAIIVNNGTLTIASGVNGSAGSSVTILSGATLNLAGNVAPNVIDTLTTSGNLALGSQNLTVLSAYTNANFGTGNSFNNRANVTGAGQILAAGATPATAQTLSGNLVGGTTTGAAAIDFGQRPRRQFRHAQLPDRQQWHRGRDSGAIQTARRGGDGRRRPARAPTARTVNGGNITDGRFSGTGVTSSNWGPVANGATTAPLNGVTSVQAIGNATSSPNPLNWATSTSARNVRSPAWRYRTPTTHSAEQLGINSVTGSAGFSGSQCVRLGPDRARRDTGGCGDGGCIGNGIRRRQHRHGLDPIRERRHQRRSLVHATELEPADDQRDGDRLQPGGGQHDADAGDDCESAYRRQQQPGADGGQQRRRRERLPKC